MEDSNRRIEGFEGRSKISSTLPNESNDAPPSAGPASKQKSARNRLMDLIARRNYSEFELRQRLADDYPEDEINSAIEFARESKWLVPENELAEQVVATLSRKGKGREFINQYLQEKGLPAVAADPSDEVEKARAIVESKMARHLPKEGGIGYEEETKIYRLLANRGFDEDTISQVIALMKKNSAKESRP